MWEYKATSWGGCEDTQCLHTVGEKCALVWTLWTSILELLQTLEVERPHDHGPLLSMYTKLFRAYYKRKLF